MSEADVLYSEVKFTKKKGNTDGTASSPPGPAVRISSTQPSSELPGSQQQLVSNGRSKVTWERVLLVVLGVLLAAAVIALGLTSYKNMEVTQNLDAVGRNLTANKELTQKLTDELDAVGKNFTANKELTQKLTDELDAVGRNLTANKELTQKLTDELDAVGRNLTAHKELLQNLTDKLDGLGKVTEGWECYYFSIDKATWEESKRQCKCRGGNLVKIDSREEQEFLVMKLKGKSNRGEEYFWMGLTDSKKEGTWLWADDSPLDQSLKFWSPGQPDDSKETSQFPDGEDCVAMWSDNRVVELNSWADQPCGFTRRYICDKPTQTSHLKCV